MLLFLIRVLYQLTVLHDLAHIQEREVSFRKLQLQLRPGPVKSIYEEGSSTILTGSSLVGQLLLLQLQSRYSLGQLSTLGLEANNSALRQLSLGFSLSQFQLKSF